VLVGALMIASVSGGLAEGLQVKVGAIGGVAPEGTVGPALSLKVMPIGSNEGQEAGALWFDVAATTEDFSRWGLMTGLSADIQGVGNLTGGLVERGGFGRDWTREMWVLYVSRSFVSLFK